MLAFFRFQEWSRAGKGQGVLRFDRRDGGSNRHGCRRGHAPTPGYKLARRFWPGHTRARVLARLRGVL